MLISYSCYGVSFPAGRSISQTLTWKVFPPLGECQMETRRSGNPAVIRSISGPTASHCPHVLHPPPQVLKYQAASAVLSASLGKFRHCSSCCWKIPQLPPQISWHGAASRVSASDEPGCDLMFCSHVDSWRCAINPCFTVHLTDPQHQKRTANFANNKVLASRHWVMLKWTLIWDVLLDGRIYG